MKINIECAVQCGDTLGEVPLWCDRTKLLWWVDVRRPALQSYDPVSGEYCARRLPDGMVVGSIAMCESGGFLLAADTGVYGYDLESRAPPRLLVDPEEGKRHLRLNDGKCDRRGRFWVGSMPDARRGEAIGGLYRIDSDLSCVKMLDGVILPNAISWSPDDKHMYFADTWRQIIWRFDFDIDDGHIFNRRVFKDWTGQPGRPDGATVDVEGYVWNAMIITGQLVRLAPDGRVDRVVQLPVTNPTCPAFGGEARDILFVTSHSLRLAPEVVAAQPYTGALLRLDVGVRGLPEPRFNDLTLTGS